MNPIYINPKIKKVIILIIGLFLIGVVYLIYENTYFHLVGTSPSLSNISNIAPYLDINFNNNLSSKNLKISCTNGCINNYKVNGSTLIVYFNALLNYHQTYKINIEQIENSSGSKLKNIILNFKPVYSTTLTQTELNYELNQEQQGYTKYAPSVNYKILSYLPFYGPGSSYQITYNTSTIASTGKVQIVIVSQDQTAQQAALNYLESLNGYNASQYQIIFENQQ